MNFEIFSTSLANRLNLPKSIFNIDYTNEKKLPFNSDLKYPLVNYEPHEITNLSPINKYHYSKRPDQNLEWISLHYSEKNQGRLLEIVNDILGETVELIVDEKDNYDFLSDEGFRLLSYKVGNECRLDVIRNCQDESG
jgi:hypothetical protein